jgi:hypothetical protein
MSILFLFDNLTTSTNYNSFSSSIYDIDFFNIFDKIILSKDRKNLFEINNSKY